MSAIDRRASFFLIHFGALAALLLTGCADPKPRHVSAPDRGLVVLLPGVEGNTWQLTGTVNGLHDAGLDREIDIIPWGSPPLHSIQNLTNYPENQKRAQRIATRIADYYREFPDQPVTLIGFSGGGGLAVMAAEVLPNDVSLDRLILIGAAVAPDHDLAGVISRCKRGVINFYSEADWFILGVGTQVFGTIDRKNTSSAGHIGFLDGEGKLRESSGLTQIAWELAWMKTGHDGGHIGWLARNWARDYLAPAIIATSVPTKP